jgi:hypothetical protein
MIKEKFIYCEKRNTLFCHIEKNGCESLRYLVLKEENHENPENVFSEQCNKYIYKKNIYSLLKKNPNVILICRNPYSRIISGFNNKVLSNNFQALKYTQKIKNYYNTNDEKRINFKEFINYIIKDNNIDNHFKPQYIWLEKIKKFKNIKIFKLEEISKINSYLKHLNFNNVLENYNYLHNENKLIKKDIKKVYKLHYDIFKTYLIDNIIPFKHNYFNSKLKKKFINKFKNDFKIFNYSYNIK